MSSWSFLFGVIFKDHSLFGAFIIKMGFIHPFCVMKEDIHPQIYVNMPCIKKNENLRRI